MPIYEYRCQACEHQFDALQKMSDAPLKDCPACGKPELVKLVSAPSFRLSGSGWYETDFKTDKDKKRNLAESGKQESSKKESSDEKKPQTAKADSSKVDTKKPAAKKESTKSPAA